MDDKVCAVDTAMDDIRGHGISSAGNNRDMGDVVLVEQMMDDGESLTNGTDGTDGVAALKI